MLFAILIARFSFACVITRFYAKAEKTFENLFHKLFFDFVSKISTIACAIYVLLFKKGRNRCYYHYTIHSYGKNRSARLRALRTLTLLRFDGFHQNLLRAD